MYKSKLIVNNRRIIQQDNNINSTRNNTLQDSTINNTINQLNILQNNNYRFIGKDVNTNNNINNIVNTEKTTYLNRLNRTLEYNIQI